MQDALITAEELAIKLRVRPKTVSEWRRRGWLPSVKITEKSFRYDFGEVVTALKLRSDSIGVEEAVSNE